MSSTIATLAVVAALLAPQVAVGGDDEEQIDQETFEREYPWEPPESYPTVVSLADRFETPEGYDRVEVPADSWPAFLRRLPVRLDRTTVHSYAGTPISAPAAAIVALPVGDRDLQQCADAIIRLRAEFLWSHGLRDQIAFHFTSGDRSSWSGWARGERFTIEGAEVTPVNRAGTDHSRENFVDYLFHLFRYAGTASLRFDTEAVATDAAFRIGDHFVEPGSPGHAVLVLDIAEDDEGNRIALVGQSFMPAQEFHVLESPENDLAGPWYRLPENASDKLNPPSWEPFGRDQVRRFPDRSPDQ